MDLLSSPSRKSKARTVVVIVAASGILAAALAVVRATGIPMPRAVLLAPYAALDNDLYYLAAKWLGVRGQGGAVFRSFIDDSGRRNFRLVSRVYRDGSGRELSRVVDGNGVAVHCHASGAPAKLEMFSDGLPTDTCVLWSESGALVMVGFVEHPTGNRVSWHFYAGVVSPHAVEHGSHQPDPVHARSR